MTYIEKNGGWKHITGELVVIGGIIALVWFNLQESKYLHDLADEVSALRATCTSIEANEESKGD